MQRILVGLLAFLSGAVVIGAAGGRAGGLIIAGSLAALAVWRFGRCHHPSPLGLLPPIVNADGTREPARWFCERCGMTRPVMFERESQPILRYIGFDQSKASDAARRALELTKQQRVLALRRAGIGPARRPRVPQQPDAAEVVSIRQGRRFGQ
jgi:hypothetical protein